MPDESHLDEKYFIDQRRYNCPFCNRRHVSYTVDATRCFDWDDTKRCQVIFVKCASCKMESMHLSFSEIVQWVDEGGYRYQLFRRDIEDIDGAIFYSVPSSFHVVDARIPTDLRELLAEAEGCLKSNFLTGASACVRKVVYELARRFDAEGDHYEDRIKNLKGRFPGVDPTYFDTLLTIQQVTSDKVHEDSYDGWEGKHLKLMLAALHEALREIFVTPEVRKERRHGILELKSQILGEKTRPKVPLPPDEETQ